MKKNLKLIGLSMLVLVLSVGTLLAQSEDRTRKPRKEKAIDHLNLTESQGQEIKGINETYREEMKAIRKNESLSKEERKEQIKALKAERKEALSNVLTKEQKEKAAKMKKERKDKGKKGKKDKGFRKTGTPSLDEEK